jgi:23S rRNA-/tRNA-specific pseudouridylate synthase
LGDRQYAGELGRLRDRGGLRENYPAMHRVALHLETLSFTHPARKERLQIRAPWPEDLPRVMLFAGESLVTEEEAGEVA